MTPLEALTKEQKARYRDGMSLIHTSVQAQAITLARRVIVQNMTHAQIEQMAGNIVSKITRSQARLTRELGAEFMARRNAARKGTAC